MIYYIHVYTIGLNVLLLSHKFHRSHDNVDARLWSMLINKEDIDVINIVITQ